MKKQLFAALLCVVMLLTLLPVTALAVDGLKTYTFTSSQIFAATDLRTNVYFKGDTIVFTPDVIEPFASTDHGVCKTPNVGLKIAGGSDVTGGICNVNTYSSDGSGCMVSFTITSDNPVTLDYKGAGPTGIETPHPNSGDNYYAYRYLELSFVTHPTNYAVDYDLGTYGSWPSSATYPTSLVLDGNRGTYSLQIPTPQSNNSDYYFYGWSVSENARILGISNLAASDYAQIAYPVNGVTNLSLFIGFKGTGSRTGAEGFTLQALWSNMQRVATPTFSLNGGDYTSTQSVSLSCTTPNATIYYTIDGSIPSNLTSTAYTVPIEVSATTTITAIAYPPASVSLAASEVVSETYTIGTPPVESVATPTFSPATGTFTSAQSVTLSCATAGATIRYTTNGNDPTESSPVYSSAIPVSSTTTIKAKAFKDGMTASAVATATYTIAITPPPVETVATPTFNPAAGTYTSAQSVTLSCATAGASIRYTTNGSEPTSSSPVYSSAIPVSSTTTIKAKAFKDGMTASTVVSATYTISTQPGPDSDPTPTEYPVLEGANGKWTAGSADGLTVRVNGDYAKFQGVSVDGNIISNDKYTDKPGSTVVTLKAAYLETLSAGNHTLRINFTDGYAETTFTVAARELDPVPQTGDSSNTTLWIALLLIGATGAIGTSAYFRKKRHSTAE